jgi:hypothetical protein
VLGLLYWSILLPQIPGTDKHVSLDERNSLICVRYAAGETLQAIAHDFGISHLYAHDDSSSKALAEEEQNAHLKEMSVSCPIGHTRHKTLQP